MKSYADWKKCFKNVLIKLNKFMGHLIKSHSFTVNTENKECTVHITLDLNLNLANNELSINSQPFVAQKEELKEEQPTMEIPTFQSTPKIKFGKKIENI